MKETRISLTRAEWSVMECLWEAGPLTGREVIQRMEKSCGWSRSTTLTLLSRLCSGGEGTQGIYPGPAAGRGRLGGDKRFPRPGVPGEPEPDGQRSDEEAGPVPGGIG